MLVLYDRRYSIQLAAAYGVPMNCQINMHFQVHKVC